MSLEEFTKLSTNVVDKLSTKSNKKEVHFMLSKLIYLWQNPSAYQVYSEVILKAEPSLNAYSTTGNKFQECLMKTQELVKSLKTSEKEKASNLIFHFSKTLLTNSD